jgi:thiamine transporter
MNMKELSKTRVLTECAVCVALSVVLSLITLFRMPLGGSVTPFQMLPVIVVSLRHNAKWGLLSAFVFGMTQLALGVSSVTAVPVRTFGYMALCAALDYVVAYTFLGLAGPVARKVDKRPSGAIIGVLAAGAGRLLCSWISGVAIWGPYAPEGWNVAVYSLAYNAAWCVPDVAITLAGCLVLLNVKAFDIFPLKRKNESCDMVK